MQITKNQHYVPQFYMKPFSIVKNEGTKKEKVLVSFYQFKDKLIRDNIPTSSVCSEDFFYDEDGTIENMLAEKERIWARAISHFVKSEEKVEEDINSVKEFAIYQMSRTKAMLEHSQEMATAMITNTLVNQTLTSDEMFKGMVEKKVEEDITPEIVLKLVDDILPTINDLELSIIDNKTDIAFITSDVPLIITNPYAIHRAGLGDIGTVIFFPISQQKMVVIYDKKLYGNIEQEITNQELVKDFNRYQYISADERLLAMNTDEFAELIEDEELNKKREEFYTAKKTSTIFDGVGTLIAAKSRSVKYYYDISIFKLPKSLRKIPRDFRETFQRDYTFEARRAVLCRIYREPNFIKDEEKKNHWKQCQKYSKVLLEYLDYYWNTSKADCIISPELMYKLKNVPVDVFAPEEIQNQFMR